MHENLNDDAPTAIEYRDTRDLPRDGVLVLYGACRWSAAEKPDKLMAALAGSHSVISAWQNDRLVGLGNAITDGALVVYYPHLLVHPDFRGRGIGRQIMQRLMDRYLGFHQHAILADGDAGAFYRKLGFTRPANVHAMWVYSAADHGPTDAWTSKLERYTWAAMRTFERSRWTERSSRQNAALCLVIGKLLLFIIMLLAFFGESESVLVIAPMVAAVGYATAIITWPLMSSRVLAYSLLGPIATTLGALSIVAFDGGYFVLIAIIGMLFLAPIVAAIAARQVLREVLHWPIVPRFERSPTFQFSLKTLLTAMTLFAIYMAIAGFIVKMNLRDDIQVGSSIFALTNILLCGLLIGRFAYNRNRLSRAPTAE